MADEHSARCTRVAVAHREQAAALLALRAEAQRLTRAVEELQRKQGKSPELGRLAEQARRLVFAVGRL